MILFQRGSTSWGFQFGRWYFYVMYPAYWLVKPNPPIRTKYTLRIWSGIKKDPDYGQ